MVNPHIMVEYFMAIFRKYYWIALALFVFFIDQLSKKLVMDSCAMEGSIEIFPILNISLVFNRGAAFSFLNSAGGWQNWLFIGVALGVSFLIIRWYLQGRMQHRGSIIAAALILGGTLGNMWDRIFRGMVVDFIECHWGSWYYPVFNFADAAITVGAIIFIIDIFTHGDVSTQR